MAYCQRGSHTGGRAAKRHERAQGTHTRCRRPRHWCVPPPNPDFFTAEAAPSLQQLSLQSNGAKIASPGWSLHELHAAGVCPLCTSRLTASLRSAQSHLRTSDGVCPLPRPPQAARACLAGAASRAPAGGSTPLNHVLRRSRCAGGRAQQPPRLDVATGAPLRPERLALCSSSDCKPPAAARRSAAPPAPTASSSAPPAAAPGPPARLAPACPSSITAMDSECGPHTLWPLGLRLCKPYLAPQLVPWPLLPPRSARHPPRANRHR